MHSDFIGFITVLINNEVGFVIVGAHALGFHGIPRYTGDLEVYYLNRETMIKNKISPGRDKDIVDVKLLLTETLTQK